VAYGLYADGVAGLTRKARSSAVTSLPTANDAGSPVTDALAEETVKPSARSSAVTSLPTANDAGSPVTDALAEETVKPSYGSMWPELIQRPPQPAAHPPAERRRQGPAAVTQHRGGLGRGHLCQVRQLTGHPRDHPGALLTAQLGPPQNGPSISPLMWADGSPNGPSPARSLAHDRRVPKRSAYTQKSGCFRL
jgi:hypothetical protein